MCTLTVVRQRVKKIRREVRQTIITGMKAITVVENTFNIHIDQGLTRPMTRVLGIGKSCEAQELCGLPHDDA